MEVLVLEKGSSNLGYCEFVLLYRISLVLPKTLAIELLGKQNRFHSLVPQISPTNCTQQQV